jgi:hypothetical protein
MATNPNDQTILAVSLMGQNVLKAHAISRICRRKKCKSLWTVLVVGEAVKPVTKKAVLEVSPALGIGSKAMAVAVTMKRAAATKVSGHKRQDSKKIIVGHHHIPIPALATVIKANGRNNGTKVVKALTMTHEVKVSGHKVLRTHVVKVSGRKAMANGHKALMTHEAKVSGRTALGFPLPKAMMLNGRILANQMALAAKRAG